MIIIIIYKSSMTPVWSDMDFGLKLKKELSKGVGVTVEVRLHRSKG